MSATAGAVLGSIASGLIAATLSHPLDTIKTCMQGDVERKRYHNMRQTVRFFLFFFCSSPLSFYGVPSLTDFQLTEFMHKTQKKRNRPFLIFFLSSVKSIALSLLLNPLGICIAINHLHCF